MAMKVQAARLLVWKRAWDFENGGDNTVSTAFAKAYAADTAMQVTTDAVQDLRGDQPNPARNRGARAI